MKMSHQILIITLSLATLVLAAGCKKKDWTAPGRGEGPKMSISNEFSNISQKNEGERIVIPVTANSPHGIKRLSYYFIMETANGTAPGAPVHFDWPDFPTQAQQDIAFTVLPGMVELVLVSFDKENNVSEIHIPMSEIRNLPVINFTGGIDSVGRVFINRPYDITGTITSTYDLTSVSYKTIIDGVVSGETTIPLTNPRNIPFDISIVVPNYLSDVVITARNIHNGIARDTFKIGEVGNLALAGGRTDLEVYNDSLNVISGIIVSASDIINITYAISTNGVYGTETNIPFTRGDEINFSASFAGTLGMDTLRFTTTNDEGRVQHYTMPVTEVLTPLLRFKNVVLTSAIGPGNYNWFAPWKAPYRFNVPDAAANQEDISLGLIRHGTGYRLVTPSLYDVAGYDVSIAPYMEGFTLSTYTLLTAFRTSVTAVTMDTVLYEKNLNNYINLRVKPPGAQGGENYNVTAAYRRLSDNILTTSANRGLIIGWGSRSIAANSVNHQAYGLIFIRSVTIANNVCTLTLDITVPRPNMQREYNPVSMGTYP